jgi:DNA-binding transcriptional ArsR family regulator
MLRLHFTSEDLARTRIAADPSPMWEVLLSLHRLRRRDGGAMFGDWARRVRSRVPASTRMLADLAPQHGYCADFLTPATKASLEVGVEALRRTPRRQLQADLTELANRHRRHLPGWTTRLAAGDSEALRHLGEAVTDYFYACLAPYWQRIRAQVAREHARQARMMADSGCEQVLRTLHLSARWKYPVLELDFPADHDIHLDSRGVTLLPSFFCWGAPTTLLDPELPPIVVYPIERTLGWAAREPDAQRNALVGLLGRTRANVLAAISEGDCTTTELAARVGVPLPTASQQATTLREAGIVISQPRGRRVLHTITPLGVALLNGHNPGC